MAKINVKFNDTNYQIDETALAEGKVKITTHLSGEMKGTGASISFGGTSYDVDLTKLSLAKTKFVSYLATIAGSDKTIIVTGVEYGVDSTKLAQATSTLEAWFLNLSESSGLSFSLNSDGASYSVTGIGTCTDTNLFIPSTYEGLSVTEIASNAFMKNTQIISVVIPDSVTDINSTVFSACTSLEKAVIGSGISYLGQYVFFNCKALKAVTFKGIPDSIPSNTFQNCAAVETINVPWSEGAIANAPWGATNATINYNYTEE